MQLDHRFYLFRNQSGILRFDFNGTLEGLFGKGPVPWSVGSGAVFLTRTKEEGFELASLFLVHGISSPVEIFDAATERVLANDFLNQGKNLITTWQPQEAEWVRRSGKAEVYLKLSS